MLKTLITITPNDEVTDPFAWTNQITTWVLNEQTINMLGYSKREVELYNYYVGCLKVFVSAELHEQFITTLNEASGCDFRYMIKHLTPAECKLLKRMKAYA